MNRIARRRPGNFRRTRSATVVSVPNTSNSLTPITAHYSLNMTLKKAFYKLRESCRYSTALAVGMQFCRIALFYIPQHGYYDSPKYDNLKAQNAQDAVLIADLTVVEILPQVEFNKSSGKNSVLDLEGTAQEAKTLREAARANAKLVISERSKMASRNHYNQGGGISGKRIVEVVDHHSDSSPSWFRACGACDILLCGSAKNVVWPTSNPLTVMREKDVEKYGDTKGYFNNNVHVVPADKKMLPTSSISEVYTAQYQQYQHAEVKFERSTSAPPILWQPPSRNERASLMQRQISTVKEESKRSSAPCPASFSLLDDDQCTDEHPQDIESEQSEFLSDLDRALYLSSLELQRHSPQDTFTSLSQSSLSNVPYETNSKIANAGLKYQYNFHKISEEQRIQVSFLNTYQGRIRESTNACTVIAPLMAIHYLCNIESLKIRNPVLLRVDRNYSYDPNNPAEDSNNCTPKCVGDIGIKDEIITAVIDIQAPLVVPQVREHLGLHIDALIVPSDAHDYLINENFLQQDQFIGVYGGNILDNDHLGAFLRDFSEYGFDDEDWKGKNGGNIKKVAATLYFHQHVICIHRLTTMHYGDNDSNRGNTTKQPKSNFFRSIRNCGKKSSRKKQLEYSIPYGEVVVFDVIDSLPSARTLTSRKKRNGGQGSGWLQRTARIRCAGKKSLHSYLMWYACSKFSQEDQMFIDSYQFDANKVDLDPRVFQTFIWSE